MLEFSKHGVRLLKHPFNIHLLYSLPSIVQQQCTSVIWGIHSYWKGSKVSERQALNTTKV